MKIFLTLFGFPIIVGSFLYFGAFTALTYFLIFSMGLNLFKSLSFYLVTMHHAPLLKLDDKEFLENETIIRKTVEVYAKKIKEGKLTLMEYDDNTIIFFNVFRWISIFSIVGLCIAYFPTLVPIFLTFCAFALIAFMTSIEYMNVQERMFRKFQRTVVAVHHKSKRT